MLLQQELSHMEINTRIPLADLSAIYGDEMLAHELALEERMVAMGRDQIRKQIEQARQQGNESGTRYGKTLIAMSVDSIGAAIEAFIERATGKAGRRHVALKYLRMVPSDVAAFIAIRVVVDALTGKRRMLQRVAVTIGSRMEDEVRFTEFAKDTPAVFKRAQERAKGGAYHRRKATMSGYEKHQRGEEWVGWPEIDRLQLGAALIDMLLDTGLVSVGTEVKGKKNTVKVLEPTPKLLKWIEADNNKSELLFPTQQPMVVRPLPWTTPFDGGYLTALAQGPMTMVKTRNQAYLSELADNADTMPAVYSTINALQDTRWRVNARVNATAQEFWDIAPEATPLPSREDWEMVQCPACKEQIPMPSMNTRKRSEHTCFEDEDVLKAWKRAAFRQHEANVSMRSKRMATAKTLKVAEAFVGFDAIHFPHNFDFRGRVYAVGSFHPQGQDITKGLIEFADGMAIEDGVAAGWLAIQGANVYGYDKASLEDRIGWVEEHTDLIIETALDPLSNIAWMQAKSPWQFLAFCFEWADFHTQGYGFVSHLPVALDGSCSGIQHFSAMLRDPMGGKAVNLIPQDTPADIYQTVCDQVIAKLNGVINQLPATIAIATPIDTPPSGEEEEGEEAIAITIEGAIAMAKGWLSLEPNRSTTKRQVMTLPYGSTLFSCRSYTEQWLKGRIAEGYTNPFGEKETFKATQFMSKMIWDSISEVVVAARDAMGWLQKCASVVAKEELPVYWITPSGFPVMQRYQNYKLRRVETKIGDATIRLSLQDEIDTIDKRRMANAISPNVVHSLDATHLVLSTDLAVTNGISAFAMIHDSFGTHAANTALLSACLREAFVGLYHETDVLEDLRQQFLRQVAPEQQAKILPVPAKGTLDVSAVRHSDFFFA